MKNEIKGTNSEGKETGTQMSDLEQKEEINTQWEQNEEIRIQKNEERLRSSLETFQHPNYRGAREEEEEQEIENLFEQIMKENFPNLVKEIDFQEVQEAQSPKEAGPKGGTHQGTSSLHHPRLKRRRES